MDIEIGRAKRSKHEHVMAELNGTVVHCSRRPMDAEAFHAVLSPAAIPERLA